MFTKEESKRKVSEIFLENFTNKDTPIVLYGTGINTYEILRAAKSYNIVGLMDIKKEGEIISGLRVLNAEEVVGKSECIVIVARDEVIPIIYNRISMLEEKGICIYNVKHEKINNSSSKNYKNNKYWKQNKKDLMDKIACNDIITFDVFDTVLVRKVIRPEDIFDIVEKKIEKTKYKCAFSEIRKNAAKSAYKEKIYPTYTQIYDFMKDKYGLPDDTIEFLANIEWETEQEFMDCRKIVSEMTSYAKSLGKKVFLLSDMYYGKKEIADLLKKFNINDYDDIFVSSDIQKSKWPDGASYKWIKDKFGYDKRYLHIGDSIGADIEKAKENGFDTFYIMSVYDMTVQSSVSKLLVNVKTLSDSIVIGMLSNRLFNNPFVLSSACGDVAVTEYFDYGYLGYGALVAGMIIWMTRLAEKETNPHIWFLSRDGYILEKVYSIYEKYRNKKLPPADYVLSSRRSVAVASIKSEDDIKYNLKLVPADMSNSDMLKNRFGLSEVCDVDEKSREELVFKLKNEILENAKNERCCYKEYLDKYCKNDEKVILFDAVSSGTIAYYIEKILEKKVSLYCIVAMEICDYSVIDEVDVYSYIGNDFNFIRKFNVSKQIATMESVLTSKEPSFVCIDLERNFLFTNKEKSQDRANELESVHDGIINFAEEFYKLTSYDGIDEISGDLADDCFGIFNSEKIVGIENIKYTFGVENNF